ncbi:MAG: hypothetical protein JWO80_2619 [Bryobacterales bacterium]|nr:hypothetical protein [Bryobacterales bacterium]
MLLRYYVNDQPMLDWEKRRPGYGVQIDANPIPSTQKTGSDRS